MRPCAREGCKNLATRDEFCSTVCAKAFYDVAPLEPEEDKRERYNRRRRVKTLQKKHGGNTVAVPNPDATAYLLPGSPGTGKRRSTDRRWTK